MNIIQNQKSANKNSINKKDKNNTKQITLPNKKEKKEKKPKIHKFQGLKDNNKSNKEKVFKTNQLNNKSNNKDIFINLDTMELINEIISDEKLLSKIQYLQLWWKTIFHIIKIQKYLRGFLQRVKSAKFKQLKEKMNLSIEQFSFVIKRIIYKSAIEKIKNVCEKKIKIKSPKKKKIQLKNNSINNNEYFPFDKVFLTSRKMNEKQKPKIKHDKLKFNNFKLAHQYSLTKRKNLNNNNVNTQKENTKESKKIQNKKICQCFNTSSNFI